MKVIEPNARYMEHDGSAAQFIERIGRTCYKSEDKITEDSAIGFVGRLIKSKHWAMLEHETVYTIMTTSVAETFLMELFYNNIPTDFLVTTFSNESHNPMPVAVSGYSQTAYTVISGSIRAFYDIFKAYFPACDSKAYPCVPVNWMFGEISDMYPWAFEDVTRPEVIPDRDNGAPLNRCLTREQFCEIFADHPSILSRHLTHTVCFTVDRGVTHEFCRHRRTSYAMESTRYVSYNKDKYGSEITVIKPTFYETGSDEYKTWYEGCSHDEDTYMKLTNNLNRTAQEARGNLPHSVKADLIMTATEEQWQHFIDLRADGTTGAPHPQAREAAIIWARLLAEKTNGRVKSRIV